jgi:uncharacterized protein YcbK (DUF882 family)
MRATGPGLASLVLALAAWLAPAAPAAAAPGTTTTADHPSGNAGSADQPLPPDVKKRRRIEAKQSSTLAAAPAAGATAAPAPGAMPTRAPGAAAAPVHARWHERLQARLGKPATPVINIFNTWTHEYLAVDDPAAISQAAADRFFRCHFTGQPTRMDPRLLAALVAAARHFRVRDVHIVSAHRAPKYNLMLRKKGREVARDSQHTHGSAVDFRLPGVPVARLHAWATQQRLGGVGLYTGSGFIHMDTGRIRSWNGR